MDLSRVGLLLLLLLSVACTHRFEIDGRGDLLSSSGERDCVMEQGFCEYRITEAYNEVFTAVARPGWVFDRWVGCLEKNGNECSFSVSAEIVRENYGETYQSTAVFLPLTQLLSMAPDGTPADADSSNAVVSADGRYVVFESAASNLVENDTNNATDLFLYDREQATLQRVSVDSAGNQANGNSLNPAISADGQFLVWHSNASNLVSGDSNNTNDVFLKNLSSGSVQLVSVGIGGAAANNSSTNASVSANGNLVVFQSDADNLVANDNNGGTDIFLKNLGSGATFRVSVDSAGNAGSGRNSASGNPMISGNGEYVVFDTFAGLVPEDTNGASDVYSHELSTGSTIRISTPLDGENSNGGSRKPSISADGNLVAFESNASNLTEADSNDASDAFVFNRLTGSISRVSEASDGDAGNASSTDVVISGSGAVLVFASFADNLINDDENQLQDVYLKDLSTGSITRLSTGLSTAGADGASFGPAIAADGSVAVFSSLAANLDSGVADNLAVDVFLRVIPSE